jgi:hypothetical protein
MKFVIVTLFAASLAVAVTERKKDEYSDAQSVLEKFSEAVYKKDPAELLRLRDAVTLEEWRDLVKEFQDTVNDGMSTPDSQLLKKRYSMCEKFMKMSLEEEHARGRESKDSKAKRYLRYFLACVSPSEE